MSNNKQSSVDFIHDSLIKYIGFEDIESTKIFDKIFEQAKAMHNEEVTSFTADWSIQWKYEDGKSINEYYNETF